MILKKILTALIVLLTLIPFTSENFISANNQISITEESTTESSTPDPNTSPTDFQQPTGPATMLGNTVFSRGFISEPAANTIFTLKKGNQEIIDYVTTFIFVGRESESVKMTYWYFEDNLWKKGDFTEGRDYTVTVRKQTVEANSRFTATVTIDTNSDTFIPGKSYWIQYSHAFTGGRILHSNLARLDIQNADIPANGIEVEAQYSETFIDRDNNLLKARFTNPDSTDAIRWALNSDIESLTLVSPENMNTMYTLNQQTDFFKNNVNSTFEAGFPAQFTASSIEHPNVSNSLTVHIGGLPALSENYKTSTTWKPSQIAFDHMLASISHYRILNITSYWELFYLHDSELKNPLYDFEATEYGFENLRQTADNIENFTIPELHIIQKNIDEKFKARIKFTIQYQLPHSREIKEEVIYSNVAEINARDTAKINHAPNFEFSTTENDINNENILTLKNKIESGANNLSVLDIYCPENSQYNLNVSMSELKNTITGKDSGLDFSIELDNFNIPIQPGISGTILQVDESQAIDLFDEKAIMKITKSSVNIEKNETYQADITWTLTPATKQTNSL